MVMRLGKTSFAYGQYGLDTTGNGVGMTLKCSHNNISLQ